MRREFLFTGLLAPRHDISSGKWSISSELGTRILNGVTQNHKGVDIATYTGTALYSPLDGVVEIANRNKSSDAGIYVAIRLANGDLIRFLHLHSLEAYIVQGYKNKMEKSTGIKRRKTVCEFETSTFTR